MLCLLKIRRDAFFQIASLADVESLAFGAHHPVYAGCAGQGGDESLGIERRRRQGARAPLGRERFASENHGALRRKVAMSRITASNMAAVSRFVCVL